MHDGSILNHGHVTSAGSAGVAQSTTGLIRPAFPWSLLGAQGQTLSMPLGCSPQLERKLAARGTRDTGKFKFSSSSNAETASRCFPHPQHLLDQREAQWEQPRFQGSTDCSNKSQLTFCTWFSMQQDHRGCCKLTQNQRSCVTRSPMRWGWLPPGSMLDPNPPSNTPEEEKDPQVGVKVCAARVKMRIRPDSF